MRINLKKPSHWPTACVHYWWNDPGMRGTEWPGEPMQQVSDDAFIFDLPEQNSVSFVLNGGSNTCQTEDLFFEGDECWSDGEELRDSPPAADKDLVFPHALKKALIVSFDDGVVQDERLIALFNKYGIRGTFHLNSGLMNESTKIPASRVAEVYAGHEVSLHSSTHSSLYNATQDDLRQEIFEDKARLWKLIGYEPRGISYPFGSYNLELIRKMPEWGLHYGRVVPQTNDFRLPGDLKRWRGTCHHRDCAHFAEQFLTHTSETASLFMVWGHSWEFDGGGANNNWEYIEQFCRRLGNRSDIWYATAWEFTEYLIAHRAQSRANSSRHSVV